LNLCIRNCKTYPGAGCDTDHKLLVATMKIRLNGRKKKSISKRLDLEKLHGEQGLEYTVEVKNKFEVLNTREEERTPYEIWLETKEIMLTAADATIGLKSTPRRKHGYLMRSLTLSTGKWRPNKKTTSSTSS